MIHSIQGTSFTVRDLDHAPADGLMIMHWGSDIHGEQIGVVREDDGFLVLRIYPKEFAGEANKDLYVFTRTTEQPDAFYSHRLPEDDPRVAQYFSDLLMEDLL